MSHRGITTVVDYGRHAWSRWHAMHPYVWQIHLPIDVLGVIMDHCTHAAKMALGCASRDLYNLLTARIKAANVHVRHRTNGGRNYDLLTVRRFTGIFTRSPTVRLDDYAYLIAPKCENCGVVVGDSTVHKESPEEYWSMHRGGVEVIYVGYRALHVYTTTCDKKICLGHTLYDVAAIRMRMAAEHPAEYRIFYTIMMKYTIGGNTHNGAIARMILSHMVRDVVERKFVKHAQLMRWRAIIYADFKKYITHSPLPLHALHYTMFAKIIDMLSLRDIKMMKCVSKLQKMTFTGAEIHLKHKEAQNTN